MSDKQTPDALRYILWRYEQDHRGDDHQARVAEARDWLAALEQAAPVSAWERDFPPEWDRHPWATWACLVASWSSYDGITLHWNYFEDKPEWGELSYNWVSGTHGYANPVTRRSLRAFFDTKDTLRQRPPASQPQG